MSWLTGVAMFRFPPITIGVCIAIISGMVLLHGLRSLSRYEKMSAMPVDIRVERFIESPPEDVTHVNLKNVLPGSRVYPEPMLEDGSWEKVYICLFSRSTWLRSRSAWRLPRNYTSVIVELDGVSGQDELDELLADGDLNVYYWSDDQVLDDEIYNRMAYDYRGMQFSKCLMCKAGGPAPSPDYGNNCLIVGFGGFILAFVGVIGYYGIRLVWPFIFRERDPWYDEDESKVKNRAGLPPIPVSDKTVSEQLKDPEEAALLLDSLSKSKV